MHVYALTSSQSLHETLDLFLTREAAEAELREILEDEPDYGGFLRGRIVTFRGRQLVVVYCRPTALAAPGPTLTQFIRGLSAVPARRSPKTTREMMASRQLERRFAVK